MCVCTNYESERKHLPRFHPCFLHLPSSSLLHLCFPTIFPAMYVFLSSLSGCQTTFCCHGNEWYSKGLKACSRSCHLYSCCCCYHWHPTYHIRLLLPCTAGGGSLLPWLQISQSFDWLHITQLHFCIYMYLGLCISYYMAASAIYQILALYDVRALGPLRHTVPISGIWRAPPCNN